MPNLNVSKNGLTPEQAEIITQTLPVVDASTGRITPSFYSRIFAAHPKLIADTFNRGDQEQDVQQRVLVASVATSAATLVDPDAPAPEELLSRIGYKHIPIGVKSERYPTVHGHPFDTIEEILTPEVFQEATRDAWGAVYLEMQRVLIDFERGLYDDLGVGTGNILCAARVVPREERGDDVVVFFVKLDYESPVPYLPGWYISVRQIMSDDAHQLHQYSLVGGKEGVLIFAVRRVDASEDLPASEVPTQLQEKVWPGDVIKISLPADDLVLNMKSGNPVVFISAGIGATSMIGMLNVLVAANFKCDVVILHADRVEATDTLRAGRDDAVAALANVCRQVWYEPDLMDLTDVDLPERAQYYPCGGNGFLQAVRKQFTDHRVDRSNVHFELFSPDDWPLDV